VGRRKSTFLIYSKYLKKKDKDSNKNKLSPTMGYLSTVADARISLEKLYNSNNNSST
jgi:hypothetical protein